MSRSEALRLKRIKTNLKRRAAILDSIRAFFKREGFLEVETPLLVPQVAPEEFIDPFAADGWFLSTSPEMHMKRLLAAGYGNVFQIAHCFRKGERGQLHNPEFTMLEWYRVGADYLAIIEDTERLVLAVAGDLGLGSIVRYRGADIDLSCPWPRTTVSEAFRDCAGWDPVLEIDPKRFDLDLVDKVMPGLASDRPMVLLDYPAANASMARLKRGSEKVAERAEVFIGGLELANAYSELTDAAELERRFRKVIEENKGSKGQTPLPRRFLRAVTNLPACGGIALGVDRLVMLLCDAASIDEVVAFPRELA
ncbi:MAG: EF-P lysine aminoacylase EpmA [Dehalococcoidia bacterium]|nr:EF-P lysine aminoacylase EpmA [Dehalococcoidia bacterium]